MCDKSANPYSQIALIEMQRRQLECAIGTKLDKSHEDDYKSSLHMLMESGVKKGFHGYDTVYLISDSKQFDLLRRHVKIGYAEVTRFESYTEVYRYPEVSGFFKGKGWYKPVGIERDRYDDHERRSYDYEIRLVLPVVDESSWEMR